MRTGLRLILEKAPELTIIGEAAGREEALEMTRLQPDIILLNLNAGNDSYLNFLPDLLAVARGARILVLIDNFDLELHHRVVRLGVKGLVQKTESAEDMIAAIKKVYAGEVWLDSKTVSHVLDELLYARETKSGGVSRNQGLRITRRERDIIALIGEGLRNKQIAERLEISEPTVRHYLTSIFEKAGVTDRLGLIIYAYQHGLAKPPAMTPRPQKVAERSVQSELLLEGNLLTQNE
jgi:DNA-binding NarL/FixJ family response regulator